MPRLRVAVKMGGGITFAQEYSSEAAVAAAGYLERCDVVSDHECGAVLSHWVRYIFLGL
jgi:hypothetical protein